MAAPGLSDAVDLTLDSEDDADPGRVACPAMRCCSLLLSKAALLLCLCLTSSLFPQLDSLAKLFKCVLSLIQHKHHS